MARVVGASAAATKSRRRNPTPMFQRILFGRFILFSMSRFGGIVVDIATIAVLVLVPDFSGLSKLFEWKKEKVVSLL